MINTIYLLGTSCGVVFAVVGALLWYFPHDIISGLYNLQLMGI